MIFSSSPAVRLALGLLWTLVLAAGCSGGDPDPSPSDNSGGAPNATGGATGTGGSGLDPDGACRDVECPGSLACVDVDGTAECRCPPGEDCGTVDECADDPCDPDADCVDLSDGFRCECGDGFSGNGIECFPGDLCDEVECPGDNQICRTDGVTASCRCRTGFVQGAGVDCFDINECAEADVCGEGAECVNQPGSFRCECAAGYLPDEARSGCLNRNECQSGENACDATRGQCADDEGSYSCRCTNDSVGDGYFCKAAADAACDPNPCENGGECVETPSSFLCLCPLGTSGELCDDVTTCALSVVLNEESSPVVADEKLRTALHAVTGIPAGNDITVADLAGITSLSLASDGVTSLEGLECWTTLEALNLFDNAVSELAPLAALHRLRELTLSCNLVDDVSALDNHLLLERLNVSVNAACDTPTLLQSIAPISSLVGLRRLDLTGQGVTEADFLAPLTRLVELHMSSNALSNALDLSTLVDLQILNLADNQLSTPTGLDELPSLRRLNLALNGIASVGELSELQRLQRLNLTGNELVNVAGLASLLDILELNLNNNSIANPGALSALERVGNLTLSKNPLTSIEGLVENPDFGRGGVLTLLDTGLVCEDEVANLRRLESRGMFVQNECLATP